MDCEKLRAIDEPSGDALNERFRDVDPLKLRAEGLPDELIDERDRPEETLDGDLLKLPAEALADERPRDEGARAVDRL